MDLTLLPWGKGAIPFQPDTYPSEVWHMGPETFADIQKIFADAGYGGGDVAAYRIAYRYGKPIFTNYTVKVHYEW